MICISPKEYIELKQMVKNECARRKYTDSVSSYSSNKYDYSIPPANNGPILKEHYEKIVEPMNAINKNNTPIVESLHKIVDDQDILLQKEWVEKYSNRNIHDNVNTDCHNNSCAGMCFSCTGECVGTCSGTCTKSCRESCNNTCNYDCYGECKGSCDGGCKGTCTVVCGNHGCTGGCESGCGAEIGGGPSGCETCGSNCTGISK